MNRRSPPLRSLWLAAGLLFLYTPIISLIVYSFNSSKLVTVWAGFSTQWYGALFHDRQILGAALLSGKIAFLSATLATLLGTLAAVVLSRHGPFRGRALFSALVGAPLVMPEVISGLALLLLFVALEHSIGWPPTRGMLTVIIAHTTLAMSYVTVVMQSRLVGIDPALEEAAQDLGASPLKAFLSVTLPIISPALVAGWLLAFTLSLDDLVVSSFVSGPGASTLPMIIYSKVRLGISPEINALATLLILAVAVAVTLAGYLVRERDVRE